VDKLLCHPLVQDFVLPYLKNVTNLEHSQKILGNLKEGLITHLVGQCQSKLVMAKDIMCTFDSSSQLGKSGKGIAWILGINMCNMKKGMQRRLLLDMQKDAFWLTSQHQRHSNCVS
jgi:hypothetical protein